MHISNYEAGFWTGVGVTVIVRFLWVAARDWFRRTLK